MSPIVAGLERRMAEIGRIRIGATESYRRSDGSTGSRPARLETFRLTSQSHDLIESAAEAFGGAVTRWEGAWQVVTDVAELEVVVPPFGGFSQWYELWSAGGCQRRCDGQVEQLSLRECMCPVDAAARREAAKAKPPAACRPTTRLSLILPTLPGLGLWRLESHGFYAAAELGGPADLLARAAAAGRPVPARLRLEQRERRVAGQPTSRYAVPRLEVVSIGAAELMSIAAGDVAMPAIGPGWTRAPLQLGAGATGDVVAAADQMYSRETMPPAPEPPAVIRAVDPAAFAAAALAVFPGLRNPAALSEAARSRVLEELDRRELTGARS